MKIKTKEVVHMTGEEAKRFLGKLVEKKTQKEVESVVEEEGGFSFVLKEIERDLNEQG